MLTILTHLKSKCYLQYARTITNFSNNFHLHAAPLTPRIRLKQSTLLIPCFVVIIKESEIILFVENVGEEYNFE